MVSLTRREPLAPALHLRKRCASCSAGLVDFNPSLSHLLTQSRTRMLHCLTRSSPCTTVAHILRRCDTHIMPHRRPMLAPLPHCPTHVHTTQHDPRHGASAALPRPRRGGARRGRCDGRVSRYLIPATRIKFDTAGCITVSADCAPTRRGAKGLAHSARQSLMVQARWRLAA